MKSLIQWPRNKYLNVWVCEYANGAAGHALYPGSVAGGQNSDMDGIVLQHTYCEASGPPTSTAQRTLTHEVGHWLNLRHPWGNSNNPGQPENCDEDDLVDDTPTLGLDVLRHQRRKLRVLGQRPELHGVQLLATCSPKASNACASAALSTTAQEPAVHPSQFGGHGRGRPGQLWQCSS